MKTVPATTLAAAAAASTFATACNSATHSQGTTGRMLPGLRMGHPSSRTKTTTTANEISALLSCPVTRLLSENHLHSDVRLVVCSLPRGGGQDDNNDETSKETNDKSESLSSQRQLPKKKKKKKQQPLKDSNSETQQPETEKLPNDDVGADTDSPKKESNTNSSKATSHKKHNKKPSQNPTTSSTASARSNKIVEDILTHEDYYHVLGLDKTSAKATTQNEITKAYRKRAVQTHPDKTGGDRRAFDKVAEAYDILSDETKKQLYDQYGKTGVAQGGGGMPTSYQDMFRSMFQQQQEQQRQRQQPRNRTMRYQLQVTLEELYQGMTQTVRVTPPNQRMSRQQQTAQSGKDIQVHIPKGSISGEAIVLSGEMDFVQDTTPGDLIFILNQVPHGTFTRKGHDLAIELVISLDEAICGVRRTIQHLDGRSIVIQSAYHDQHHPNNKSPTTRGGDKSSFDNKRKEEPRTTNGIPCLIQTGDVQVLKGQGMPKRHHRHSHHVDDDGDNKDNFTFGDLYVQYRVELPKASAKSQLSLSEDERNELGRLLRKVQGTERQAHIAKSKKNDATNDEVNYLQLATRGDFGRASGPVIMEEDHHPVDDDGDGEELFQNPFGSTFFQRSNSNGGSSSFYFGSSSFGTNPFGGGSGGPGQEEDGSNVQCNQM
jgi:DnaJ-class molecular chaperone